MASNLFDKVSDDIRKAMLAREKVRLGALRGVKKVKQRKESAEIYKSNNRPELADNELAEAAVIEEYLPKQLSEEELENELRAIIAETGATGPAQMGKVMGVASKRLAGRAEGKAINAAVRRILESL